MLYAFEHCLDSSLSTPLKQAIRDLLTRIRGGMQPDDALVMFAGYSKTEHFQDLVFALRFNFRHRGNLPALLELLEIQQNKLEEAYNDRQISNRNDLRITLGLLILVPVLLIGRMSRQASIRQAFLTRGLGLTLLFASLICYGLAILWYIRLSSQIQ